MESLEIIFILVFEAILLASARSNGQCGMKFPPFREGYCFRSSACPGAVFRSLCQHEAEGIGCCMLEYSSSYSRVESNITMKMFKDIFGDTTRSQALFFDFLRSLADSRVSSCHQQSAYIAQIAYDTNYLSSMEKIPLDEELKNKTELKYIGRGAIHISGEKFYNWLQPKVNYKIVDMPEMLAFPSLSFRSAGIVWAHSYAASEDGPIKTTSYNQLADGSRYGFLLSSYYLRGHIKDVDKLVKVWRKANKALRCECTDAEGPQCRVGDQSGRCRLRNECIGRQAESTDSCLGPADVVMCSLGTYKSVQIDIYFEERESWTYPSRLKTITKTFKEAAAMSEGEISWKSFSKDDFSLETKWNNKRKSLAAIIFESNKNKSLVVQDAIRTKMPHQKPGVLLLDIGAKDGVELIDGILNAKWKISNGTLRDKLTEKIHSGPWFIPMNRKLVYDLARLESSLLTISVAKRINFVPLIIVKTYRGQISIEGLKHFNQLPLYGKTYCKIETQNDTFNGGKPSMEDVLVRYTTSFSNDAREERLKAMVVNSKVLLIVRGAMNVNSASIKASEYNNERKGQQNKEMHRSMSLMISLFTVIASCSMSLLFICAIFRSTKKNLKSRIEISDKDDEVSVVIRSTLEQSRHSEELLDSECQTEEQNGKDDAGNQGMDEEITRILLISRHIEINKLLSVLLYSFSFVLKKLIPKFTGSVILFDYALRYFSILVYEFLILESEEKFQKWLEKIQTSSNKKCKLLFHALIWVVPALVASIPSILWVAIGKNWMWIDVVVMIELPSKGILFTIAMILSVIRFVKQIYNKEGNEYWCKQVIPILFNLHFTVVWFLNTFEAQLAPLHWFNYFHASINFLLAIFVCVSVYWQMKQSLLAIKMGRKCNMDEGGDV